MSGEQWYGNDDWDGRGTKERDGCLPPYCPLISNFKWITQAFHCIGFAQQEGIPEIPVQILTFRVKGWQLSPTWPMGVQILMLLTQILTAQHMPPPHCESLSQAWNKTNRQINIDSGKGSGWGTLKLTGKILFKYPNAQPVKYLPHKHEDTSSILRTHKKSQTWWLVLAIPALGRWRQASPWHLVAKQSSQIGTF